MTNTNKIIKEIIPQQVRVRKYKVDVDALKETLREAKKNSRLTNGEIANKLNKPKTLVDHWFRNDNCFSIPDEDIWLDLKNLLHIQTDEFDESIMTFEIRDGVFDKSNRVYDSNGIAPTLTCASSENERYKVYEDANKIIRVGQVSNKGSQAGMVYDAEGLFPTVCACTHGYAIGNILDNQCSTTKISKLNHKGVDGMWNNNLEKLNFEMEEIRIFDSFCGIGALHQALKELGVPIRLVGVSEIDIDAIISYAAVHIDNFKGLAFEYPSVEEMKELLQSRNIGYDFKTKKSKITRMKIDKLKLVYKATILLNNLGDISTINAQEIPDFDIFNMSFPCQAFSMAGKRMGVNDFRGTLGFTSIDILNVKKPKYFLIENVPGLISIDNGNTLKNMLRLCCDSGYKIATNTLNSKEFGIPQNRNRLFILGVLRNGL